jgi:hypothetical protein
MSWQDNPYFPKELHDAMLYDKATDESKYKWIWEGEPIGQEDNTLITPDILKKAYERTPMHTDEPIIAGLDVARMGGDKTCLVWRQGNKVIRFAQITQADNIDVAQWAQDQIMTYPASYLVVDATGMVGAYDALNRIYRIPNCDLIEYIASPRAKQADKYVNLRAEVWDRMKIWIRDCGTLQKTSESDYLSVISYFYPSGGTKMQLVSKEAMRTKGLASPDFGDALSMTFVDLGPSKKTQDQILKAMFGR